MTCNRLACVVLGFALAILCTTDLHKGQREPVRPLSTTHSSGLLTGP